MRMIITCETKFAGTSLLRRAVAKSPISASTSTLSSSRGASLPEVLGMVEPVEKDPDTAQAVAAFAEEAKGAKVSRRVGARAFVRA